MTRQKTMAANESKLAAMRETRAKLNQEKEEMESYNSKTLESADRINGEFTQIAERMEKARIRRQETVAVKAQILARQTTIVEKKRELDSELEGVDFGSALATVKNIKMDDVVFL